MEEYKINFFVDDYGRYCFGNQSNTILCSKEMYDEWISLNKPNWYTVNRHLFKDEEEFKRLYNLKAFW